MAVTLVQNKVGTSNFGSTHTDATFDNPTVQGNCILAGVQIWNSSPGGILVSSVADDASDSFSFVTGSLEDISTGTGTQMSVSWYLAKNIAAQTANKILVTLSGFTFAFVQIFELSGYDSNNPIDLVKIATGISNAPSAGSGNTARDGEYGLALVMQESGVVGIFGNGSGWTLTENSGGGASSEGCENKAIPSAGSVVGDFTSSVSSDWVVSMVTVQPPSAGDIVTVTGQYQLR